MIKMFLNSSTPDLLALLQESPINIKERFFALGYDAAQFENARVELIHAKLADVLVDGSIKLGEHPNGI